MIACSSLTKFYSGELAECALHSVDLYIGKGEFVVIRGHVGAGKSTLLRLLCGLIDPTSGTIEVHGVRLPTGRRRLAALRRTMGIIEQEPRLIEKASIYENVALGLEVLGLTGGNLKRKTIESLRSLGLEAQAGLRPDRLSAGQRQKVCVARALAGEPLIVLADEPCRHLDADGASEVLSYLRWLNLQGSTVVAVCGECWPPMDVPARCLKLTRGRLTIEAAAAKGMKCAC
ncbi:MAG: ATP-binding cassette domain-containing protein [Pseudomonadota bacterium]